MIPPVIHKFWHSGFAGLPEPLRKAHAYTQAVLDPYGYQVKLWDESDFDRAALPTVLDWNQPAFVSDYLRCRLVGDQGGWWFDCDVIPVDVPRFVALSDRDRCFFWDERHGAAVASAFGADAGEPLLKEAADRMGSGELPVYHVSIQKVLEPLAPEFLPYAALAPGVPDPPDPILCDVHAGTWYDTTGAMMKARVNDMARLLERRYNINPFG